MPSKDPEVLRRAQEKYRQSHRAKRRAYSRKWQKKNRARWLTRMRAWYEAHKNDPDYIKARKARTRKHYEANKHEPEFKRKRLESVKRYQHTAAGKRRKLHWRLMGDYGMSIEEYDALAAKQNNTCAICKRPQRPVRIHARSITRLAVDHDHKTHKNRGLLCSDCNPALGGFQDSIEILESAIRYLRSYAKVGIAQ